MAKDPNFPGGPALYHFIHQKGIPIMAIINLVSSGLSKRIANNLPNFPWKLRKLGQSLETTIHDAQAGPKSRFTAITCLSFGHTFYP